jgi:hypothetical protein
LKQPADWATLDLEGDPILIVGRRPKPRVLQGYVVDLHSETFPTMRSIAHATTEELRKRQPMAWHPNADMIPGEQYLTVQIGDLPTSLPATAPNLAPEGPVVAHPLADAADLIRLVLAPGQLDNLDPALLSSERFRFYAIAWEAADGGQPIAFVSEYDPTTVLKKASSYFRYDGTLRNAAAPDFALDDRADLVITGTEVAILNPAAFDRLFADIRSLLNDVPTYTSALKTAMAGLSISTGTETAIIEVCATKPSLARQLQSLCTSTHTASITPQSLRDVLKRHGQTPADFIIKGVLHIDADQVGTFLDVAEGRWYEADFTSEPRRAARWSRRR